MVGPAPPGPRTLNRRLSCLQSVVDHDTWTMDLKAANRDGRPQWMRLYSARRAYNMPSLTPSSWTRLVRDMATNDNVFDSFYR